MSRHEQISIGELTVEKVKYRNSTAEVEIGPQDYAFVTGGQLVATVGGSTATRLPSTAPILATDYPLAVYSSTDDTDTINTTTIDGNDVIVTCSADPSTAHGFNYAVAKANAIPQLAVWAAGEATTAGGDVTETITVTGALATDIVLAQIGTSPATNNYDILTAVATANTITVVFGTDPSTTHTIQYALLRAVGSFTPSHRIYTCTGPTTTTADASGRATNDLTISGLRTTDLCFHSVHTASAAIQVDGSDRSTAGTVTVGFTANPSTTNKFKTVVLRAVGT